MFSQVNISPKTHYCKLQERGAEEDTSGVSFPNAEGGTGRGEGGKDWPWGHEEGGGGVLQYGSFGWRFNQFHAEELTA